MRQRKGNYKIPAFGLTNSFRSNYAIKNLSRENTMPGEHNINLPHRDDHYMLVFVQHGNLKVTIDFEKFEVAGPNLLMVFPDQVHHIVAENQLIGWAISFESDFINEELRSDLDKHWRNRSPVDVEVGIEWLKHIDRLLSAIYQLNNKPLLSARSVVSGLLSGILYIILGHLIPIETSLKNQKNRPALIKHQFITLLYQHYKDWKKPSIYAGELNISTAHLNDTVKSITGRSATEAIQEHCILEARRLLTHTDLSIKDIAFEIGYGNFSHFIKVFKNITGTTPNQYRQIRK
jgi:AraC family transcriptional activator of pobA